MGLVPRFTATDIQAELEKRLRGIDAAIINSLAYVGEQCVNQARSVTSYRDQTGNLRNSVGYVIVKNGRIVKRSFKRSATVVVKGGDGRNRKTRGSEDGTLYGELLAEDLAQNYPSGYALIVVAGMNYAAAVESRGQDVLSTAEKLAETELPRLIAQLKSQIDANDFRGRL